MTAEEWPQPPHLRAVNDTDDETEPDLILTNAEQVGPDDAGLPVETDGAHVPAVVEGTLLPALPDRDPRKVLPPWFESPQIFIRYIGHQTRVASTTVAFHTLRIPQYWMMLLLLSPRGLWRGFLGWCRWVSDSDAGTYLRGLTHTEAAYYARIDTNRRIGTKVRWIVSAIVVALLTWAVWWAQENLRTWVHIVAVVLLLTAFGFIGRNEGQRIVQHSVQFDQPPLTYELLITALNSLGISQLSSSIKEFGSKAVIMRSPIGYQGRGWRCEFDLPAGVPASEVVSKRDRLAAGLVRPVSAVWPTTVPDQAANRLSLYVADKPLSQMKAHPWPLSKAGQTSIFAPFIIGQDPTGAPVHITLMFTSGICGAIPRRGKTFSLRVIALGASLDPTCELHIYDFKGGADWMPFEQVAFRFRAGDDDDDIEYLVGDLREMVQDMRRRYKTLKELPRSMVPEGKITPELAARKDLGLHPVLLVLDETQVIYSHAVHGKEIEALVTELTRRGPAAGIMAYSATQQVSKDTIPRAISTTAIVRLAFKVLDHNESNQILGNVSGQGYNAATFGPSDVGIGYLAGEGAEPVVVRFAYVDGPQAAAVITRARAVRKARGLLSGYAAGEDLEPTPSTLEHILEVWPIGESRSSFAALAERLEEQHPDAYANWGVEQVSATIRAAGIKPVGVNRAGQNLKGVTLQALQEATHGV